MQDTVSKTELEREGKRLVELLQRIDNEAHDHTFEHVRRARGDMTSEPEKSGCDLQHSEHTKVNKADWRSKGSS